MLIDFYQAAMRLRPQIDWSAIGFSLMPLDAGPRRTPEDRDWIDPEPAPVPEEDAEDEEVPPGRDDAEREDTA